MSIFKTGTQRKMKVEKLPEGGWKAIWLTNNKTDTLSVEVRETKQEAISAIKCVIDSCLSHVET